MEYKHLKKLENELGNLYIQFNKNSEFNNYGPFRITLDMFFDDLISLGSTNRYWCNLIKNDDFWRIKVFHSFGKLEIPDNMKWIDYYSILKDKF